MPLTKLANMIFHSFRCAAPPRDIHYTTYVYIYLFAHLNDAQKRNKHQIQTQT